ncbi:MAG TPA: GTPase domain-containing protein, partial [Kofleriaceae bacterium]
LCGKTANLNYVFAATKPESRGKMISLETETERTLFFDFLPLDLGKIGDYKVRFHLYTVPGQVFYDASRKLILKGADGVVFVADSQSARAEANIESLENLEQNLGAYKGSLAQMPHVVQYNKRDMPDVTSIAEMRETLNLHRAPDYEAVAKTGTGVFDTLKGLAKLVLNNVAKQGV